MAYILYPNTDAHMPGDTHHRTVSAGSLHCLQLPAWQSITGYDHRNETHTIYCTQPILFSVKMIITLLLFTPRTDLVQRVY